MKNLLKSLPSLLMAVGAFVIGKNFLGHQVDESFLQEAIGVIMGIVAIVLDIRAHAASIEKIQATVRQVFLFAAGFLVAAGKLKADNVEMILGFLLMLAKIAYQYFSRKKSEQLATGEISIQQLKK
jgi:Ca2+/Na+ antiporter